MPLNWLVAAARVTRSAAAPSALRVAAPNFSVSSQKTTRMPRGAAENGTKPTLTASGIGKSSKIGAVAGREPAGRCSECSLPAAIHVRQEHGPAHYDLSAPRCQAPAVAGGPHQHELLTISRGCHGTAILLTDQRDGSERMSWLDRAAARPGDPGFGIGRGTAVPVRRAGSCGSDGVDRQVHFSHDAGVVCAGSGQPDRGDLDYAGVARHRPDDEPGPDHRHLSRHHQPGDSGAGADHLADRADDRDLAHPQQARDRFGNHRDERGRLFAVPAVPSVPLCDHRGGDPGRLHRRLSRARRHAPPEAVGRRNHRRRAHQHPAARPLRPARPEPDHPHSRAAARRRARRHLRR